MKKIVLALDDDPSCEHAVDFTSWLGQLTGSKITGIFLNNKMPGTAAASTVLQEMQNFKPPVQNSNKINVQTAAIEKNISVFKTVCEKNGNRYAVQIYSGDAANDIIRESRFADVLVIAAETSCSKKFDGVPTALVKTLLTASECPVIIAPDSFKGIDEIIFTYDGTRSSMFAIKQFCHLFPQLDEQKISLVQVAENGPVTEQEQSRLKEWLSSHYSSIGYVTLSGDAEIELLAHLIEKKNVLIVMGAYGRNSVSQYFRHSHAESLIATIGQAFFIAHP